MTPLETLEQMLEATKAWHQKKLEFLTNLKSKASSAEEAEIYQTCIDVVADFPIQILYYVDET